MKKMNLLECKPKLEGSPVDGYEFLENEGIETTYVERRVPIELEDKVHELIDQYLIKNGFDPENL